MNEYFILYMLLATPEYYGFGKHTTMAAQCAGGVLKLSEDKKSNQIFHQYHPDHYNNLFFLVSQINNTKLLTSRKCLGV